MNRNPYIFLFIHAAATAAPNIVAAATTTISPTATATTIRAFERELLRACPFGVRE